MSPPSPLPFLNRTKTIYTNTRTKPRKIPFLYFLVHRAFSGGVRQGRSTTSVRDTKTAQSTGWTGTDVSTVGYRNASHSACPAMVGTVFVREKQCAQLSYATGLSTLAPLVVFLFGRGECAPPRRKSVPSKEENAGVFHKVRGKNFTFTPSEKSRGTGELNWISPVWITTWVMTVKSHQGLLLFHFGVSIPKWNSASRLHGQRHQLNWRCSVDKHPCVLSCSGEIWSNVQEATRESGGWSKLSQAQPVKRVRRALQWGGYSKQQHVSKVMNAKQVLVVVKTFCSSSVQSLCFWAAPLKAAESPCCCRLLEHGCPRLPKGCVLSRKALLSLQQTNLEAMFCDPERESDKWRSTSWDAHSNESLFTQQCRKSCAQFWGQSLEQLEGELEVEKCQRAFVCL